MADVLSVPSNKSVPDTVAALTAAVEGAGAKVFAVVDHGAGAQAVGQDIGGSVLVIFGNPKIGTPAMQADGRSGLALPLHVLVTEADGKTVLQYEQPNARFADLLGAPLPAEITTPMSNALGKLTAKAAE